MTAVSVFHRPELARRLTDRILDNSPTSASRSGIFLVAPRRTGLSTFIRADLLPALERREVVVISIPLSADPRIDPGEMIAKGVRSALGKRETAVKRTTTSLGIADDSVGSINFSLERIGIGKDVTLTQTLAALSEEVKCLVVIVIDDVQQVLSSQAGMDSLFALKAARDELNSSAHSGLRLVFSGTHGGKLAMLRGSVDQAFYGAPLVALPHLNRDYVERFCANISLPGALEPDAVWGLFEKAGWQPERLDVAADQLRLNIEGTPAYLQSRFAAAVEEQIMMATTEILHTLQTLTELQTAVLRVFAESGTDYHPFEATTFTRYHAALAEVSSSANAEIDIPSTLAALRGLEEGSLIWTTSRGVYEWEDPTVAEVLLECPS
ncbi:ATP-binding protein [Zoogloea oleivorans]|uniref:ATP-binding protein n=1 Tax=Zoogloea oleivorans TaxID=1552750 RepID=A0A6C2CCC2_9RHOO|nr:ATP-binding protein [Zoogloea oleivorans]TYC50785.1 ATP-binding protein [Zoogloea oleivorans]